MPDLKTKGQLSRAQNWIQGIKIIKMNFIRISFFFIDWKSKLDDIQPELIVC
jgi:hypothetical protein